MPLQQPVNGQLSTAEGCQQSWLCIMLKGGNSHGPPAPPIWQLGRGRGCPLSEKTRGYEILDRNYRSSWGEIDIIARQRDVLAFVEVKTRHSLKFGRPAAAVTREKQIRLRKTAWCYLRENQVFRYRSRFDIIEILDLYGKISLNHLKNCF